MTGGVLVIGYGNTLRTDDGAGRLVAERIATDARFREATVVAVHQLMPELALDISRADRVVLIDAGHGVAAGEFSIEGVSRLSAPDTTWSHHIDPASLLALAHELYGSDPLALVVTIGIASTDAADRLSPVVEAAIPRIVEAVAALGEPTHA